MIISKGVQNMNTIVKNFIEQNIELIEQRDWENLFSIWYNDYCNYGDDNKEVEEIFQIIDSTGIATRIESRAARWNILEKHVIDYVEDCKLQQKYIVTVMGAVISMRSWLGIQGLTNRIQFVRQVFKKLQMVPDENKWTYSL